MYIHAYIKQNFYLMDMRISCNYTVTQRLSSFKSKNSLAWFCWDHRTCTLWRGRNCLYDIGSFKEGSIVCMYICVYVHMYIFEWVVTDLTDVVEVPMRNSLLGGQFPHLVQQHMKVKPCLKVTQPPITKWLTETTHIYNWYSLCLTTLPICDTQTLYHICYFILYTNISQNGCQEDFLWLHFSLSWQNCLWQFLENSQFHVY